MLYIKTTTQEAAVPHKTNRVQITLTSLTCCHYRTSAIITTYKQSLGQGNVFTCTPVSHSVHRGCVYPSMQWGWGVCIPACNGAGGVTRGCVLPVGFVTRDV